MESYNAKDSIDEPTYFNHLMLGGEVRELTSKEDFDPENLQVDLRINGEVVVIKDFNEVLKDWGSRIERQVADKVQLNASEEEVKRRAKALVKEKLGDVMEKMSGLEDLIEDSIWKLEV